MIMRDMRKAAARIVLALTILGAGAAATRADDEDADHERARAALTRGDIRPLAEIYTLVRPRIDGEIVETELEREDGRWVYEIKYISRSGRMRELYIDAKTGKTIKTEEH